MQSAPEPTEHHTVSLPDRRQLLPVSEVAARTGLSRWTIYRRINSGVWPSGRCGRNHLIPRAFIDGLLAAVESGRQVSFDDFGRSWPHEAEGVA